MMIKTCLALFTLILTLVSIAYAASPTEPTALLPLNQTALNYIPEFSWINSSDIDGDAITYILEFANDSIFAATVLTANTTTSLNVSTPILPSQGIFYWHIIATDGSLNATSPDARQFIYDFTPPNITNETNSPDPVFNVTDVTLTSIIQDNLNENVTISSVWVEIDYNGLMLNYTASKNLDGVYSYTIDDKNLTTNQTINYTFYALDSAGNEAKGTTKFFTVNGTLLFINPSLPDGLNNWYVTNPTIELKTNLDGVITYKWDELAQINYTVPFNASQILPVGGQQLLKYWSRDSINTILEPQKNFTIKIDLTDPALISAYPANNSVIGDIQPVIYAIMDDTYFDNSQIDTSTITFVFDDLLVAHSTAGATTINISYLPAPLSAGAHNASITAADYAGNTASYNWTFTMDISPINLAMLNPLNQSYNTSNIKLNLTANKTVDFYKSLDNSDYVKICNDCQDYEKPFSFSEGSHFLSIKAVNGASNEELANISLFVDTVSPQIFATSPNNNAFISSGNFSITYKELNLNSVNLYYKPNTSLIYSNISLLCNSSTSLNSNQDCSAIVDLSPYNGAAINYYFTISDGLHLTSSSLKNFTADTLIPAINIISPESANYSIRRVRIDMQTDSLSTMAYVDNFTEVALCNSCSSYNNTKSFKDSLHNITFIITDKAGNKNNVSLNFFVDSRAPRIRKTSPLNNKFSNGNFSIQYTESNLSKARLFYYTNPLALTEVILPSCLSGKNQDCSASLDMSAYENQIVSFFFNISDSVRETESRINNVTIDTISPASAIISPANATYSSSSVLLNITSTENSFISYSDNNGIFKVLCSSCSSILSTKFFDEGSHYLTIKTIDKANNIDLKTVSFSVE